MIVLHHLNQSRSRRILWLLEEIGEPYRVVAYQRQKQNFLAPPELKNIHPLGKSPVIEFDGHLLSESGAITEWLINRFAPRLAPAPDSFDYAEYLQWIHFAESSAMLPLLLMIFGRRDGDAQSLLAYAKQEADNIFGYLDRYMEGRRYLVAEKLTGADFMMSFVLDILKRHDRLRVYPQLQRYADLLSSTSSWIRAAELDRQYEVSS